jgi:hypothetical protein
MQRNVPSTPLLLTDSWMRRGRTNIGASVGRTAAEAVFLEGNCVLRTLPARGRTIDEGPIDRND